MDQSIEYRKQGKAMRLVVSTDAGAGWADWTARLQGTIYHSVAWAEAQRSETRSPLYFSWVDDHGFCNGVAIGIKRWSPIRYIGRYSKRLDFESYPAVQGGGDLINTLIKELVDYARQEGYRSVAVNSYYAGAFIPDLRDAGLLAHPRIEFLIDLTQSDDELWKGLSAHHQRKIKKADRQGLVFEVSTDVDAMRYFRELQTVSRNRKKQPGEYVVMPEESCYAEMGNSYLRNDLGRVFLMTHEGRVVSAALISLYRGRALYVLGGTSEEGFAREAPVLLFWKAMSRCRELGCRELNLGGVPAGASNPGAPSHGLYRFKSNFGGRQAPCISGSAEDLSSVRGLVASGIHRVRSSAQRLFSPGDVSQHYQG